MDGFVRRHSGCPALQEAFPFGMSKQTSDALGMVEEAEPMHLFETPFADGQVTVHGVRGACLARAVWRLTTRSRLHTHRRCCACLTESLVGGIGERRFWDGQERAAERIQRIAVGVLLFGVRADEHGD